MAGDQGLGAAGRLDPVRGRLGPSVVLRGRPAVSRGGLRVGLDDPVRVEAARDVGPGVDGAKRVRDPDQVPWLAHPLRKHRRALDEPGHQESLGFDERDDLGTDADGRGHSGRRRLPLPVDAEEVRVLAGHPEDDRLVVEGHLEVVVRDPAAERLDREGPGGPFAFDDVLGSHGAILPAPSSEHEIRRPAGTLRP